MAQNRRSDFVHGTDVTLEVYVDGTGPALVVLPSYGRDGAADFDDFASKVGAAGFTVLHPQPQGIAGSRGDMEGLTLHDLAGDIALVICDLARGKAIVLGHAFRNAVARMIATAKDRLQRTDCKGQDCKGQDCKGQTAKDMHRIPPSVPNSSSGNAIRCDRYRPRRNVRVELQHSP
jgi:hypothetical protein